MTNSPQISLGSQEAARVFAAAGDALKRVIEERPPTEQLLTEMVRQSGGALQAGAAGTWVTESPDAPELILEHNLGPIGLMVNNVPLTGLNVAVRRAAREAKPVIVPAFFVEPDASPDVPTNPSAYELLFIPMKLHGKVAMVLMLAVTSSNDAGMHRTQINFLQKMVGAVEQTLTERHLSLMERDHGVTSKMLKFAEQVHKHLFVGQVAVDIANLVRDAVDADRVTVELYPRVRKKVLAVSNVDEPSKRSAIFQAQRLILDYVRDRHVPVVLDREAAKQLVSDPTLQDAATAYFAVSTFGAFLAVPIRHDDKVVGVIIAEHADAAKAHQYSAMLSDLARVAASSVANAVEYESIPLRKLLHGIRTIWRGPTSTKRTMAMSIAGIAAVVLVFICAVPMRFAVKTDCALRPLMHQSVSAPVEGRINEVPVRAGEHVYPDPNPQRLPREKLSPEVRRRLDSVKPLAVFDTTEFVAQRAEQMAKLSELQTQLGALSDKDKDALARRRSIQDQLASVQGAVTELDRKIQSCWVYAPFEGTVLTENVEQKNLATVRIGEPLMEIAAFDGWVLVADVPETEIATVREALHRATQAGINDGKDDPGINVEYILYPWPDHRYKAQAQGVGRLLPSAVQANNKNVFRLEIPVKAEDLPPGLSMSGVTGRAKLHIGKSPLAAQWMRGPMRLFRMTVGF